MSLSLQWNDKGLKAIFDALSVKQQQEFHKKAQKATANEIAKMVKQTATADGLARTGEASKNGWSWVRFGRVANSIASGKLWARGGKQAVRVFNKGARRLGFMKSAPHAHLVILGHKKWVPQRDGTTKLVGKSDGVPIYNASFGRSRALFEKNLEKSVSQMIKRLNRQGKL